MFCVKWDHVHETILERVKEKSASRIQKLEWSLKTIQPGPLISQWRRSTDRVRASLRVPDRGGGSLGPRSQIFWVSSTSLVRCCIPLHPGDEGMAVRRTSLENVILSLQIIGNPWGSVRSRVTRLYVCKTRKHGLNSSIKTLCPFSEGWFRSPSSTEEWWTIGFQKKIHSLQKPNIRPQFVGQCGQSSGVQASLQPCDSQFIFLLALVADHSGTSQMQSPSLGDQMRGWEAVKARESWDGENSPGGTLHWCWVWGVTICPFAESHRLF